MDVAQRIAEELVEGFDRHYRRFRAASAQAKRRFEEARWDEVQRAVGERHLFYDERVLETVARLRGAFDTAAIDAATWQRVKLLTIGLLVEHKQPELAESFFNSVMTRILERTYARNDLIFVRATISTEYIASDPPVYRSYYPAARGLAATLVEVFEDFGWSRPFADLARDAAAVARTVEEHAGGTLGQPAPNLQLQVLAAAFYRNKAAYVLGKVVNGNGETPLAVPVLHDADGLLALDAALLDEERLNILFSVSRAYFMVDVQVPSGTVGFLQTIMPTKPRADLYTALGLGRQGKTLFIRDLAYHLRHSEDLFVEAPGTRGKVMHVFNLPSYPVVFKVIKDVFGPGKDTDRSTVERKFRMVKQVDRVGRMADTIEFRNLALPLARFSPELRAQLAEVAPSSVAVDGDSLVVRHCYVERRLVPLDLYLASADDAEVEAVVREYGNAIRELAIANVFPGDMLWRNFGLTRYGRVVFYDYDEIEYLTDCRFRSMPEAPNPEAELSPEPWYGVGERDVFPEELERFLLGEPRVRAAFLRHHRALLDAAFWQECQRRIAGGEVVDFFPYPAEVRLGNGALPVTGSVPGAPVRSGTGAPP